MMDVLTTKEIGDRFGEPRYHIIRSVLRQDLKLKPTHTFQWGKGAAYVYERSLIDVNENRIREAIQLRSAPKLKNSQQFYDEQLDRIERKLDILLKASGVVLKSSDIPVGA